MTDIPQDPTSGQDDVCLCLGCQMRGLVSSWLEQADANGVGDFEQVDAVVDSIALLIADILQSGGANKRDTRIFFDQLMQRIKAARANMDADGPSKAGMH